MRHHTNLFLLIYYLHLFILLGTYLLACPCVEACIPQHVCGGQRKTCRCRFCSVLHNSDCQARWQICSPSEPSCQPQHLVLCSDGGYRTRALWMLGEHSINWVISSGCLFAFGGQGLAMESSMSQTHDAFWMLALLVCTTSGSTNVQCRTQKQIRNRKWYLRDLNTQIGEMT